MTKYDWQVVAFVLLAVSGAVARFWWDATGELIPCVLSWSLMTAVAVLGLITFSGPVRAVWTGNLIGGLLNGAVTIRNGGLMPVAPTRWHDYGSWVHVEATADHHWLFLADVLPGAISIGDVVLLLGVVAFVVLKWRASGDETVNSCVTVRQ